eukprot:Hpha_TRINITY_DN12780_c0_g2::TRINITY_DN12780_c0_g2_i1::g.114492::m.114492
MSLASIVLLAAAALRRPRVVDVEIGTQGVHIQMSSNMLYTFDPFDVQERTDSIERFPFAISDKIDGANGTFYLNERVGGCSSMNRLNPAFESNPRLLRHQASDCKQCEGPPGNVHGCPCHCPPFVLILCRTAAFYRPLQVPVRRLSSVLVELGVQRVEHLKIDAQGSDFAILRDVLENAPSVTVDTWQVECQFYQRTPAFYDARNDCQAILDYASQRLPHHTTRAHVNNCQCAEYNIVGSVIKAKTEAVFKEVREPPPAKSVPRKSPPHQPHSFPSPPPPPFRETRV